MITGAEKREDPPTAAAGVVNNVRPGESLRRWVALLIATIASACFNIGALREGSSHAGYTFTGDVLDFCWPALLKIRDLIAHGNFTAIDVSQFNGSSEFFLSPNMYGVHPVFVVFALLSSPFSVDAITMQRVLAWSLAGATAVSVYYSIRLLQEHLGWETWRASFVAVSYGCSMYFATYVVQPMFVLCAAPVPWIAFAALNWIKRPSVKTFLIGGLPVVFAMLGGYLPLGMAATGAGVALAILIAGCGGFEGQRLRFRHGILLTFPAILGLFVVSPFLLATHQFLLASPVNATVQSGISYSAHDLANSPEAAIRSLALQTPSPHQPFEVFVYIGLVGACILIVCLTRPNPFRGVPPGERRLAVSGLVIYAVSVLSTFGQASPISDLMFYFLPLLGKMHIYQRYLLITHLGLLLSLAVMLKAITHETGRADGRILLIGSGTALVSVSYFLSVHQNAARAGGLTASLVMELISVFLFLVFLRTRNRLAIGCSALLFVNLASLDKMYDWSLPANNLAHNTARNPVSLQTDQQLRIIQYLSRHTKKELVKYVDVTALWGADGRIVFPKTFPYWLVDRLKLSSYSGFNFSQAVRKDYQAMMPISKVNDQIVLVPDWSWVEATGGDFVVISAAQLAAGAIPGHLIPEDNTERLPLPKDLVLLPLKQSLRASLGVLWDNGVFRLRDAGSWAGADAILAKSTSIARGKMTRTSGSLGGARSELVVDGKVNGNYQDGGVFHSALSLQSWIEVDLGAIYPISAVRLWNRTDCCGERLQDASVYISSVPFASQSVGAGIGAGLLEKRFPLGGNKPTYTVLTGEVAGRYVRIQADSKEPTAIINLAELEVFSSNDTPRNSLFQGGPSIVTSIKSGGNWANEFAVEFENKTPIDVEYLMAYNPGLHFYLNSREIQPQFGPGVVAEMRVPAGRNRLVVRYRNVLLSLFWVFYSGYGLALVGVGARDVWRLVRSRRVSIFRG